MKKERSAAQKRASHRWLKNKKWEIQKIHGQDWKTKCCLNCGASPGRIVFIKKVLDGKLSDGTLMMKYEYECLECGEDYSDRIEEENPELY